MNEFSFFFSLIKPSQLLVLDFDGVFLDSSKIKGDSFANLFLNLSNTQIKNIKDHHINNPSLTRHQKIKIYYEWIFKKKIDVNELNLLLKEFGICCLKKMLREKPSLFIKNLLLFRGEKSLNYILTKSIESEVLKYIQSYDLDKYINKIYDCKFEKAPTLLKLALSNNVSIEDVIFIGDSLKDKESSDLAGSSFIFYQVGLLNNENKFI